MTRMEFPRGVGANCENALICFFDLSPLDIKVYKELNDNGPGTALEIGERISRDRSTAYRSVTKLVSSDIVEKKLLNREGGGIFHVYEAVTPEEVQNTLKDIVDTWYDEMVEVIERTSKDLIG
ncbi:MAG: helix-turn-helix domain-containing protein [Candidatus Thermoplasmatota archaeon]|nr:helix-turn-helix domain-containing protein [Candidatus Thermoplasmatota archaeon]